MDIYEHDTLPHPKLLKNDDPGVISSDEDEIRDNQYISCGSKSENVTNSKNGRLEIYQRTSIVNKIVWNSEPNNLGLTSSFSSINPLNKERGNMRNFSQSNRDTDMQNSLPPVCNSVDKISIFKLLEIICSYTENLRINSHNIVTKDHIDQHPIKIMSHIMKLSLEETHRKIIFELNGLQAITALIETEHSVHGSTTNETHCILLRKFACMSLSNLAFSDNNNRISLCSFREFMRALVVQLRTPNDELRQVTASILKNLCRRADTNSKDILREVGSVTGLMKAAMSEKNETSLKLILSAVSNLSNHSTKNKSEICAVENALAFLITMLRAKSSEVMELSGEILNNISSQISVRYDYRETLQQHNCLKILLDHLKSPCVTVVTNACGTLFNLSNKCSNEQETLKKMGAQEILQDLTQSKHKVIAMGASAVLKNLLVTRNITNSTGILKQSTRTYNYNYSVFPKSISVQSSPINYSLKADNLAYPVRNKFSDCGFEDDGEISEQPIDYSRKFYEKNKMYDLDQPLDYSLKYAEQETYNSKTTDDTFKTYCTEDTPVNYSTATSLSDLQIDKPKTKSEATKSVKFEENVNYALETPLMFSRSSSLESLESVGQISYQDDKSSEVSDFSRLASGIVSPSDIPDSPFQTMPTSPKSGRNNQPISNPRLSSEKMGLPLTKTLQKPSVFEDNYLNYVEEGTPVDFSATSSLSNLTLDEEVDGPKKETEELSEISEDEGDKDMLAACINSGMQSNRYCQKKVEPELKYNNDRVLTFCTEDTPAVLSRVPSDCNLSTISIADTKKDDEETFNCSEISMSDDENDDLLAECINSAMPKSKIDLKVNEQNDSIHAYCTEDTPAILSHAGSNSNLSLISDTSKVNASRYLSENSDVSDEHEDPIKKSSNVKALAQIFDKQSKNTTPNIVKKLQLNNNAIIAPEQTNGEEDKSVSSDDQNILQNCIQSAMPKSKSFQSVSEKINKFEQCRNNNKPLKSKSETKVCIIDDIQVVSPVKPEIDLLCSKSSSLLSLESLEDTEEDLALLQECISLGMKKRKENAVVDCPNSKLSQSDKDLLQNCISSAMPKNKPPPAPSVNKKKPPIVSLITEKREEPVVTKYRVRENNNLVRNSVHRQSLPLFHNKKNFEDNKDKDKHFTNKSELNRTALRRSLDNLKIKTLKNNESSAPPPLPPRPPKVTPPQETVKNRPKKTSYTENITSKFTLQNIKQSIKTVASYSNKINPAKVVIKTPVLERQCTFTKPTKIPQGAVNNSNIPRNTIYKSASSERMSFRSSINHNRTSKEPERRSFRSTIRSPSADGRFTPPGMLQNSSSSQSLNNDNIFRRSFKSAIPSPYRRSYSNSSLSPDSSSQNLMCHRK